MNLNQYARGNERLGDFWSDVSNLITKGTTVAEKAKQVVSSVTGIISPTQKAASNTVTGGAVVHYATASPAAASFPIVPMAIAGGAVLVLAFLFLKK